MVFYQLCGMVTFSFFARRAWLLDTYIYFNEVRSADFRTWFMRLDTGNFSALTICFCVSRPKSHVDARKPHLLAVNKERGSVCFVARALLLCPPYLAL